MDRQGLLANGSETASSAPEDLDDGALLAALGVEAGAPDLAELRHARSSAEKRVEEEIASRWQCEDFETFRPPFEQVQNDLDAGIRRTGTVRQIADIKAGRFFLVGGQKACVAEVGEEFAQPYGDKDARLRVFFDNGTEKTCRGDRSSVRCTRTRREG